MKRKLALLVCMVMTIVMVFALASCGGNDEECTNHTYSGEYTSDSNGHWYAATCGCKGVVSNYGAHVDKKIVNDDNTTKTGKDGICDVCKYVMCKHTFAPTYTSDADGHWYELTCGCDASLVEKTAHADEDKNGVCDACQYVMCEHPYEWETTETTHKKVYTCDCNLEATEAEEHVEEGIDGICDVCAYVICEHTPSEEDPRFCANCGTNICTHTYSEELSYDANAHWYEATCGCEVEPEKIPHEFTNYASINAAKHSMDCVCGSFVDAHADEDEDGVCDACAYEMAMKGVVDALDSEASIDTTETTIKNGNKVAYFKRYDNYIVIADAFDNVRYYSYYGENGENLFVMLIESGAAPVRDYYAEDPTEIYYYNIVYYNVQASNHEDAVKGLYNLALYGAFDSDGNQIGNSYGLVEAYDEATGVYTFSYLYVEEENYYLVEVEFTVDAEYNGVTSATFTISSYSASNVTYDALTSTYTIAEGANASSTNVYEIVQSFGEPLDSTDAPNPYKAEDYIFSGEFSVVMKDTDGNVTATFKDGDTVELEVNQSVKFYFDDATTAKLPYLNKEVISSATSAEAYMYFSTFNQAFPTTYNPKTGGNFTLTFTVEGVSLVLNVKVNFIKPTTIGAAYNDADGVKVVGDKAQMYIGDSLTILSNVATGNDPAFTAEITTGADSALIMAGKGNYTFTPYAVGTYVVTITSAVSEGVSATLTIEVVDVPNVADVLTGTHTASYNDVYQNETGTITVVFTPAEEGALNGTLTLNIKGTRKSGSYYNQTTTPIDVTATYSYSYSADTKQLTVTYVSGDTISATIALTNYVVTVDYGYAGAVKLAQTAEAPDAGEKEPTSNPFKVTITDTYTYDTDTFEFVADEAGKYVFTVPAGLGVAVDEDYYVDFYGNTNGDTFSITLAENAVVIFRLTSITKGDYYMSYTVEADGGEDDEPTVQGGLAGTYIGTDNYGNSITVTVTDTTITFQPPRSQVIEWVYTYVDGVLTLTNPDGSAVIVMPNMQGMTIENDVFTVLAYNGSIFNLEKQASEEEPEQTYAGEYIGQDRYGNEIDVTITEDTISWTTPRGNEVVLTYTVDNGVVTLYLNGNALTNPMFGYAEVDTINYVFTVISYNGTDYEMTKQTADGGDDEEGGEDDGEGEVTGDAKDANGLGGTYTFTFVMEFTITIKPSANGATSGTIDFVDPVYSQNTGTYAYTIVDGAYVIEGEKLMIAKGPDGAWYAQTPNIAMPQKFADATVVEGGDDEGGEDVDTVTELVVGDNNVSVTGDDMNMTVVTFTATEAGTINIIVGENGVVVYDYQATLELRVLTIEVTAGQVITLEVNNMYGNAGVVVITVETIAPKVEDPQGELKGLLSNYTYVIGGYNVALSQDWETGLYYIEITDNDWTIDLAFTYTLVDNGDGTFTITNLVRHEILWEAGADQLDAVKAAVENGVISANLTNNAALGYYSLNGYSLSLSRNAETGAYEANIYDDMWTVDLYFSFVATANEDGSYTIALTYTQVGWEMGTENVDAILAMTWVVTPEAE